MKNNLRELLDKIYELEGLVHLSLKREEAIPDFLRLIVKKGHEVGNLCTALEDDENKTLVPESEITNESQSSSLFTLEEYSIDENTADEKSELQDTEINDSIIEEFAPKSFQKGKLVFSINDRFRFRKELFANSDVDFNNTLALVASMEDYEEAEDYFLNEEGFDRNSPAVAAFLSIIKNYFK